MDNSSAIRYVHMQTGVRRGIIGDVLDASERYDWVHQVLANPVDPDDLSTALTIREGCTTFFTESPSDVLRFLYVVQDTEHGEATVRKVFDAWKRFQSIKDYLVSSPLGFIVEGKG